MSKKLLWKSILSPNWIRILARCSFFREKPVLLCALWILLLLHIFVRSERACVMQGWQAEARTPVVGPAEFFWRGDVLTLEDAAADDVTCLQVRWEYVVLFRCRPITNKNGRIHVVMCFSTGPFHLNTSGYALEVLSPEFALFKFGLQFWVLSTFKQKALLFLWSDMFEQHILVLLSVGVCCDDRECRYLTRRNARSQSWDNFMRGRRPSVKFQICALRAWYEETCNSNVRLHVVSPLVCVLSARKLVTVNTALSATVPT